VRRIRGRWREGGPLSSRAILRRVEELERVFAVGELDDDWVDVLMWSGENSGIFGHVHYQFSESRGETRWIACSDEEEIAIMQRHYEDEGCRSYNRGNELSFAEYLDRFSYLGSAELEARRKLVIKQVKGEENGSGVEDSAC
jgi:hypothetical protein